jgi:hypothetical protein
MKKTDPVRARRALVFQLFRDLARLRALKPLCDARDWEAIGAFVRVKGGAEIRLAILRGLRGWAD